MALPPAPSNGPGVPRQQTQPGLDAALQTMSMMDPRDAALVAAFEKSMERIVRHMGDGKDTLKSYQNSFESIMRSSASMETSMRRIQQLQSKILRAGSSKSSAVSSIKDLISEYERLLKTMNRDAGGGKFVKNINKELKSLRQTLKTVQDQSDDTWDSSQIKAVNKELVTANRNIQNIATSMKGVKVKNLREEFEALGDAVDNAFGGRLAHAMRRIPGLNGAMKALDIHKGFKGAHQGVQKVLTERRMAIQARNDAAQSAKDRVLSQKVFDTHGLRGVQAMRKMGYDPSFKMPTGKTFHRTGQLKEAVRGATSGSGRGAGSIEKMDVGVLQVGTMVVGKQQKAGGRGGRMTSKGWRRDIGPLESPVEAPALSGRRTISVPKGVFNAGRRSLSGAGKLADVAGMVGGEGGAALGGGRLSGLLRGGLSEGATSAIVGGVGGGLEGVLGALSSPMVAGPMALIGAAIAMRDQVAKNNKKISDNFRGQGLFGGDGSVGDTFDNMRASLMSTTAGQHVLYGQDMDKNISIFNALQQNGIGSVRDLSRGVDLGKALDSGEGFYGATMQNAVVHGHLAGFDTNQSIGIQTKLQEKFGRIVEASKGFFEDLNSFSNTSGITASKIVEMVDSVSDQFNDLNKSLFQTVNALNMVGKSGLFMSKRVEEALKTLTAPNEMNTAQRIVNADTIIKNGQHTAIADSLLQENERDTRAVNAERRKNKVADVDLNDKNFNLGDAIQQIRDSGASDNDKKSMINALMSLNDKHAQRKAQSDAWRSGDKVGVAALQDLAGESLPEAMTGRMALIQSKLAAAFGGDNEKARSVMRQGSAGIASVASNLGVSQMFKQSPFGGTANVFKEMQAFETAKQGYLSNLYDVGSSVANTPGGGYDYLKGSKDPADQARLRMLTGAANAMGMDNLGLKGQTFKNDSERNEALVKALLKPENLKKLQGVLGNSSWLMDQVMKNDADVSEALDKISQAEKDRQAIEKRDAEAAQTMQTAEVFANAFTFLFERVIKALDFLGRIFGGDKYEDLAAKAQLGQNAKNATQGAVTYQAAVGLNNLQGSTDPDVQDNRKKAYELLKRYQDATTDEGKREAWGKVQPILAKLGLGHITPETAEYAQRVKMGVAGGGMGFDAIASEITGGGNYLSNLESYLEASNADGTQRYTYADTRGAKNPADRVVRIDAIDSFMADHLDKLLQKTGAKAGVDYTRQGNTIIYNNVSNSQTLVHTRDSNKQQGVATKVGK